MRTLCMPANYIHSLIESDTYYRLMSFLIVDSVLRLHAYLLLRGWMYLYFVQLLHLLCWMLIVFRPVLASFVLDLICILPLDLLCWILDLGSCRCRGASPGFFFFIFVMDIVAFSHIRGSMYLYFVQFLHLLCWILFVFFHWILCISPVSIHELTRLYTV